MTATLPEIRRSRDLVEPAAPNPLPQPSPRMGALAANGEAPAYFEQILHDAERLLTYAAEGGVDVDPEVRTAILQARSRDSFPLDEQTAASLLKALTTLAAQLRPVTAESLKACCEEERHTVDGYWKVALALAVIIVPFSVASFLTSAVSDAIRKDVTTANDLAVKLTAQLRPTRLTQPAAPRADAAGIPASEVRPDVPVIDVMTELQQFAAAIRAVDGRARQLKAFMILVPEDPFADIRTNPQAIHATFELPASVPDLAKAAEDRIEVYQKVRYFAQTLLDDASFFYGAIAACILPVLYALLGTCAYLLRSFEDQMKAKTFTPSAANSARFLIAGIGGAVVGLFNNFTITQGASIPPLAIAFLVGYAVDVFFSFLEGLLQAFTKTKGGGGVPVPASTTSSKG